MLTVIIKQTNASAYFPQELSLLEFTKQSLPYVNGETFEVELLNPQKVPFYATNYEPGVDGRFDHYLLIRMKELWKRKKIDKVRYRIIQKWVEESCSEIVSISEPPSSPSVIETEVKPKVTEKETESETVSEKAPPSVRTTKKRVIKSPKLKRERQPQKTKQSKQTQGLLRGKSIQIIFIILLSVGIGFGVASMVEDHSQAKEEKIPTAKTLQKKKAYKTFLKNYPKEFWKWEQKVVQKKDIQTLTTLYQQTKERNIAFDLAFLEKKYDQTIIYYQANKDVLDMTDFRQDFLTYSYIQEKQLEIAQKRLTDTSSPLLYEEIGWAYLEENQIKQAETVAKQAKSNALTQQIQDYQLVDTTLQEVDKQLKRKGLAEAVKKKLLENQKELQAQKNSLLKRPGKESEAN